MYEDETSIRDVFGRMLEGWPDPIAYAAGFATDATHISAGGRLDRGRADIGDGQTAVLSAWGRDSARAGRIDRLQFLTPDVALLTVYGEITFDAKPAGEQNRRTIESITAQKLDGRWALVACQYTPLGHCPASADVPSSSSPSLADEGTSPGEASTAPANDDEAQIRALYRRMLDCWLDAPAYAECFTHDADYITGGGRLERGWQENVEGHQIIFSAWARDSHLAGRIDEIRFLTADIAVVTAYGHIVFHDRPDTGKRTIYTLTAQRVDGAWIFVGYQNTPLTGG